MDWLKLPALFKVAIVQWRGLSRLPFAPTGNVNQCLFTLEISWKISLFRYNNIKQSLPVYWKPLLLPYYSRGRYDSRSSTQNKCLVYLHVESIRLQTSVFKIIHDWPNTVMKLSIEPDKRYNSAYALHIKKENLFTSWHLLAPPTPFPSRQSTFFLGAASKALVSGL